MKSCKETAQSEIVVPSAAVPSAAVPCVKYPSKPLLMKSRVLTDYSRLSSRASTSNKNPNGIHQTDPLPVELGKYRNIKIGSRKPPKNLVTKNIRGIEDRVRAQEKQIIKRSYSHDSLKVSNHLCEGNPNLLNPATALPNHSHHLRKTRRSLEPISSFEKGEENLTKLFPIDPNNNNSYHISLKNMEKSMILRKRRKITMSGGDKNFLDDFKENVPHLQQLQENNLENQQQAGNLSINGEKRTLSGQKGHPMMEKKICIKNSEHRMTWIL